MHRSSSRVVLLIVGVAILCLVGSPAVIAGDAAVRQAQERLTELGYDPGPADGLWGPESRNAVMQFQRDSGLEPTGELDAQTRAQLELDATPAEAEVTRPVGDLMPWGDVSDPYDVSERPLQNAMVMEVFGNRYIIDALAEGEFLICAPGTYGGVRIAGIRGKPPKVKPLLGYIEEESPDPQFYSVLGVGSSLQLPGEWIRVFGLRLRSGTMVVHSEGLVLKDVERSE